MKGRSVLATMFACLLLTHVGVNVAWAQDEEEEGASEEEGSSEEEASTEGEESTEEASTEEEASSEEEAPAADAGGRWPRAVIARPLILPKGLARVGATINANNDFSVIGLGLRGGYGLTDKIDANVTYGLTLKEFEAKGALGVDVGYNLMTGSAGGKLDVAVRAGTGYDLLAEGASPLSIGGDIRYKISDKLAVISPPYHLTIFLEEVLGTRPIFLSIPAGVSFQATPELHVQAVTNIANIEIADSATTFIFADATPINVTATYNVQPNLDAFAGISTDLTNEPGDTLAFLVGANYYLGAL